MTRIPQYSTRSRITHCAVPTICANATSQRFESNYFYALLIGSHTIVEWQRLELHAQRRLVSATLEDDRSRPHREAGRLYTTVWSSQRRHHGQTKPTLILPIPQWRAIDCTSAHSLRASIPPSTFLNSVMTVSPGRVPRGSDLRSSYAISWRHSARTLNNPPAAG